MADINSQDDALNKIFELQDTNDERINFVKYVDLRVRPAKNDNVAYNVSDHRIISFWDTVTSCWGPSKIFEVGGAKN